jgi:hypothetical protein
MGFFSDAFTEDVDTTLASHTPDVGTSWTLLWSDGSGPTLRADGDTDSLQSGSANNSGVIYTADATPPSEDYDLAITLVAGVGLAARPFYLFVRLQDQENMYAVRLTQATNGGLLYKKVSGTWTALGSAFTCPANGSVCKLEIIGSALKFYDDGVEIASATDTDITAAGKAGLGLGGGAELVTSTDDANSVWQWDTMVVTDLGGGATQLVVQDATLALAAESLALTQHNVLAVADALVALASESPALTQHNILVAADALLALAAESPTLTAYEPAVQLVVQDALLGLGLEAPSLTQHNALAVAYVLLTIAADSPELTQHNLIAVADALLALAAESQELTQHNVLAVSDALHALAPDSPTLVAHAPGSALVVEDLQLSLSAESPAFTQHNILVAADALLGLLADSPTLDLSVELVVQDVLLGLGAETPALTQHHVLSVSDALLAIAADSPSFAQAIQLIVQDALLGLAADGVLLTLHNTAGTLEETASHLWVVEAATEKAWTVEVSE